ncbi:Aminotransferase, class IV [Gossypium australe]|uniref:Aminotransferase, class IV n=1 Tax=Gossypium australe TaxID=47621 RepID=A0A5B6WWA9_9ROSI|nr:Aminotransferase, class IV [Gossypium australe]
MLSIQIGLRKPLEKLRPPSVTELLLSNDGDRILEGCITNFFVICQRDKSEAEGKYLDDYNNEYSVEVQTSPISDGVLPALLRWISGISVGYKHMAFAFRIRVKQTAPLSDGVLPGVIRQLVALPASAAQC